MKSILAPRLRSLANQNIFVGTSSWKYPGWKGTIYSAERYPNQKRFEAECLTEYAETFPIVCGDFAFYQFPTPEFWKNLFSKTPKTFLFAFKAPEEITRPRFPKIERYAGRAGSSNLAFLDAELFRSQFLDLLLPYASQIAVIILEFGNIPRNVFASTQEFVAALRPFLDKLPKEFRYAVEIRNPEFLDEPYLELLYNFDIAHVLNSWTHMPAMLEQVRRPDVFTAKFTVARALLTPKRGYEEAVQTFSPYDSLKEPNEAVRTALREILVRAKKRAEPTYIFVNNRLEGFAPGTIAAVTD